MAVGAPMAGGVPAPAGSTTLGQMVEQYGLTSAGQPVAGAVPASSGSGITPSGIASTLPSGVPAGLGAPTLAETAKDLVGHQVIGQMLNTGVQGIQNAQAQEQIRKNERVGSAEQAQQMQDAKGLGAQVAGLAAGGGVDLHDGDFIFPADVVSALGNGSTKAGAKFLDEFFGVG